jgi:phosphatidate cytidylyltransferase
VIAIVKMGDIGAYTVGRLLGRHKLAPTLSPGKTIEGAAGAIAFGCFASWLVFRFLLPAVTEQEASNSLNWIPYGIVVSIAGMIGDLAESLLKRDLGRKDSSAWLPGFGGVLDILDSLLLSAPVGYTCWLLGLVG